MLEGKSVEKTIGKIALTAKESARYKAIKEAIKDSQHILDSEWRRIALWVWEVNNQRLYRGEYETFEEFVRAELSFNKRRAYQMVDVGAVVHELPDNVQHVAHNPLQIAELVKVRPGDRVAVLMQASKEAEDAKKPLTAKRIHVLAVKLGLIQKLLPRPKNTGGEAKPVETKERTQARKLCDAWRRACKKVRRDFMIALARDGDFKSLANMVVEDDRLLARE